jgi:predicted nucleic acid-binding protein
VGQLTLPQSVTICLDTSVVIYSVEKIERYATLMASLWAHVKNGSVRLVGSYLVLLETLVKPVKDGDSEIEQIYRELLTATEEFQLLPISMEVVELAIQLRAQYDLRTPDALHAATAQAVGCVQFITNDTQFRRVAKLPVVILDDHLSGRQLQ